PEIKGNKFSFNMKNTASNTERTINLDSKTNEAQVFNQQISSLNTDSKAGVDNFLKTEPGQSLLKTLDIKQPVNNNLDRGALSYSLAMLDTRNEYIENNKQYLMENKGAILDLSKLSGLSPQQKQDLILN